MQVEGRPYAYLDAREPETLRTLMGSLINNDGLCIVDGGGNRPGFDTWIGDAVDLVLIPVVADTESVTLARETMSRLEDNGVYHARYLLNMVSTNSHSRAFDTTHFSRSSRAGTDRRPDQARRCGQTARYAGQPVSVPDATQPCKRAGEASVQARHSSHERAVGECRHMMRWCCSHGAMVLLRQYDRVTIRQSPCGTIVSSDEKDDI